MTTSANAIFDTVIRNRVPPKDGRMVASEVALIVVSLGMVMSKEIIFCGLLRWAFLHSPTGTPAPIKRISPKRVVRL